MFQLFKIHINGNILCPIYCVSSMLIGDVYKDGATRKVIPPVKYAIRSVFFFFFFRVLDKLFRFFQSLQGSVDII